ncbi:hypothetical protein AcW1_001535 [Taiwanofungus camphoratus]|nr:hypothetical protein AcV7_003617 [Antrodia cinnamomea]KAI0938828.1 hypothetical protein AcV5_000426 [Antrodia cinnamomea]KAI0945280.1 hypothetical protein AcW1_001535 [Antrodia cinnamomea]
MNLSLWNRASTKDARRIVLSIIGSSKSPISTQEIYKRAVQEESARTGNSQPNSSVATTSESTPQPPYPSHEIRSMNYLKTVVLPSLVHTHDVEKVHSIHELTSEELEQRLQTMTKSSRKAQASLSASIDTWRWQLRAHKPTPPKPREKPVFGTEVGVGADWTHLNKRRQNARLLKVTRDVRWLRRLGNAKAEGLKAQSQGEDAATS